MLRYLHHKVKKVVLIDFNKSFFAILSLIVVFVVDGCGRAYFPIELKTISRSKRAESQETNAIKIVAMTSKAIEKANLKPYQRRVINAGNLEQPAKILFAEDALKEKFPKENDPGPYRIGIGDVISFGQIFNQNDIRSLVKRDVVVKENGFVNIIEAGRIKAEGLTQSQLEDSIFAKLIENDGNRNFELSITGFNSKKILIVNTDLSLTTLKFVSNPMFLRDAISGLGLNIESGSDVKITILRKNQEYVFSLVNLLKNSESKYRLYPDDKILVQQLNYRPETVLVVGETGAQMGVPINSFQRPTLSDTIFGTRVLNTVTSDFSQIYVLRKKGDAFNAYHLDITNPTRISFASKFEMRPDDIVFVATQPLSLYSRTLSQILGSTGLTLQARDTIRSEIAN